MNLLKKSQIKAICMSAACLIFGILFCVLPTKMLDTIETLISIVFIVYGIFNILVYCLANSDLRENLRLLKGAAATAFALLLIFVKSMFIVCLGLFIIFSGIVYIVSSTKDKKQGDKKWWIGLIFGIVLLILGLVVVVLCNTKLAQNIVMVVFGLALIADGILRLVYVFAIRKEFHNILSKKFTQKNEAIESEFEVKLPEDDKNQKSQTFDKNAEKSIKIQEKSDKNAENFADKPDNSDDDNDVEGFV